MKKTSKLYTKKVIVTNALSTPEARAERLRRLRNIANLTRQEICDRGNLNIYTYKGWEVARYGGLPVDGALKVIQCLGEMGIVCTPDWLLYGQGQDPYIIPKFILPDNHNGIPSSASEEQVIHEIMLFQSRFQNVIYTKVQDDGLAPKFITNDFIAGIRRIGKEINALIGKDCIVQTQQGEILARNLKATNQEGHFMLVCTNTDASVENPVLYDVQVMSAAPITRLYRYDVQ